jgi:hypothetical protein
MAYFYFSIDILLPREHIIASSAIKKDVGTR